MQQIAKNINCETEILLDIKGFNLIFSRCLETSWYNFYLQLKFGTCNIAIETVVGC